MMTDLAFINAAVLTQDPDHPRAEALGLSGGRIVALGSNAAVRAALPETARVIDAQGRSVLPGFIDSHVHLFQGSASLEFLPVGAFADLAAVEPALSAYVEANPDEPLLLGVGALYDLFMGTDKAPRHLLDAMVGDRPFALLAADLHTVWANTRALEAAGLLRGAPMPEGSSVVMGEDGLATGTLFETGAFGPVLALSRTGGRDMLGYVTGADPVPAATPEEREADKALLSKGLAHVSSLGITTLHNMDGNFYQLELLQELEDEGRLPVRVQVPFHLKNFDPLDRLDEATSMHQSFTGPKVWSGRVKMFMDGVMESRTGLKAKGYPDTPGTLGEAVFQPEHFNEACRRADAAGLQISVHAIGDLAVERVIDGLELARAANGRRDARHRIEHIELIQAKDIPRLADLDIVASMQPRHSPAGGFFPAPAPDTIFFPDEPQRAYAWQTLREAGVTLALSTDWPVVPLSPLESLQCAVKPLDLGEAWVDQSQSLHDALASYTAVNAWLGFREGDYGQLKVGMMADVVMLSGDIEAEDPADLSVALTLCDGQITFEA